MKSDTRTPTLTKPQLNDAQDKLCVEKTAICLGHSDILQRQHGCVRLDIKKTTLMEADDGLLLNLAGTDDPSPYQALRLPHSKSRWAQKQEQRKKVSDFVVEVHLQSTYC
jgi:hypothetical protein